MTHIALGIVALILLVVVGVTTFVYVCFLVRLLDDQDDNPDWLEDELGDNGED